jgi:two-component system chemotaxis response regulator CheY
MKRILIVDDAGTIRLYYRQVLEAAGYDVAEAANGLEGLEKALGSPFDLYLVDINMSQMDGLRFLKELRRHDLPQAPALVISSGAGPADRRAAWQAGANAYLVKPVRPDQLRGYVRLMLGEAIR